MATKKPSAKQLAARAKFVKMVRAKAAAKKKTAPKKVAKKVAAKKKAVNTHKDTKSHNVNIKVVSGVGNMYKIRDLIESDIKQTLQTIERIKISIPNMSKPEQKRAKETILGMKKAVIRYKKQLREQNSLISSNLK